MTGEMSKPKNAEKGESYWKGKKTNFGYSAIGDESIFIRPNYPEYFELADLLKKKCHVEATAEPFDVYQGGYVRVGGFKVGDEPYAMSLHGLNFWLDENGEWGERHSIGIGTMSDWVPIGSKEDVVRYVKNYQKNKNKT